MELGPVLVLFTQTLNLSIFLHEQKIWIKQIFPPILPQKTSTRHFLQNIGNPVQGKVKGQVDPAPVHIKQPHKTLRHTRQLSFDEVFYNFHVLEINSYITSEVFLTNIKYVWVS